MDYISIGIYAAWILSEILLNRLKHSKETDKKDRDNNSMKIIWITSLLSVFAGVFLSVCTYFPICSYSIIHPAGLLLVIGGVIFRFIAVKTLGNNFTVDVTIRPDHFLYTGGIYTYVRHPSYTSSMVSFLGLGLSLNNFMSLIIISVPVLIAFIYRTGIEEQLLTENFGQQYIDYKKRSYRFLRWIY